MNLNKNNEKGNYKSDKKKFQPTNLQAILIGIFFLAIGVEFSLKFFDVMGCGLVFVYGIKNFVEFTNKIYGIN